MEIILVFPNNGNKGSCFRILETKISRKNVLVEGDQDLNVGSWLLVVGFWLLVVGSRVLSRISWFLGGGFGLRILDPGPWILDPGSCTLGLGCTPDMVFSYLCTTNRLL